MFARRRASPSAKFRGSSRQPSSGSTNSAKPKNSSSTPVKVVLRIRPHNQKDHELSKYEVVDVVDDSTLIFDPKEEPDVFGSQHNTRDVSKASHRNLQFNVDKIFTHDNTNQEVFENSIKGMIEKLIDGYNCTVFAYGATGSGKTHTMIGGKDSPGIIPQLMEALYTRLTDTPDLEFQLLTSYLEVYNEKVHDLLVANSKDLTLMDTGMDVIVADLSWHKPPDAARLMAILQHGNARRTQHPTDANADSSRSHAVFQVKIKLRKKNENGQLSRDTWVHLNMIDLAGSERAAVTKNKAARLKEGANINKSLLALGNCINGLAEGQKHIPYRNSKLTRLLKGALGGNCSTVMIANISSSSLAFEDTYNTLKYASRARKIKNKVRKNTSKMSNAAISEMHRDYEAAQHTISALRSELKASAAKLEAEKHDREELLKAVLRKLKNLLGAKEEEARVTEMCSALQCQVEDVEARSKEKQNKLHILQLLESPGSIQVSLKKAEEARAAKCISLKEDLQLNKDSKLLASNFTRSTLIDLHHWMSSHPGSIAELIETMQDLLDIQANPAFVACQVEKNYLEETLKQKISENNKLHKIVCLLASFYSESVKDRHLNNLEMRTQFEKVKTIIKGGFLPADPNQASSTKPQKENPRESDGSLGFHPPQAFLFKDTPFKAITHSQKDRPSELQGKNCTPAAFTFKNTPSRGALTPPAYSE